MSLTKRCFSMADQERFAAISGDWNPMHMDAVAARRTQAGAPVVHGIHLLLWGVDALIKEYPDLPEARQLYVQFNAFTYLGELVEIRLSKRTATSARFTLSVEGAVRARVSLEFGQPEQDSGKEEPISHEPIPASNTPTCLDFEQVAGRSGTLALSPDADRNAIALFPAASHWLGSSRISGIIATTRLVGMVCPGMYSLYGELRIQKRADDGCSPYLQFRVTETDPRFHAVTQEVSGCGITGTVNCFVRTPPVQQASMESLVGIVNPTEFARSVVLIVGGTRGLGELTAKIVATGGGRVFLTWHRGKNDAERVANEIKAAFGQCETFSYDASQPPAEQLDRLPVPPTHVYYFATPRIYRPQATLYSCERMRKFCEVYVDGFWRLAQELRTLQPGISMFYPSSIFVEERPPGMTEYSMAKVAGELLCADMNKTLAPMRITVCRLPRMRTDQTASVTEADVALNLDVMLPIIKEVQAE